MFSIKTKLFNLVSWSIFTLTDIQKKYLMPLKSSHKIFDPKEFVDKGLLQEANRLFFHPRGLSLSMDKLDWSDKNNTVVKYGVVYDYTDADGIGGEFDFSNRNRDQLSTALRKAQYSQELLNKFKDKRIGKFGDVVEPITEYYRR